jgi:hypothetical protein
MRRFGIAPEGGATAVPVEIPDPEAGTVTIRQRCFIPARLVDNPFLAQSGYRERLLELPPEDRDALLHGRWQPASAFGAYYADQMRVLRSQGRIRAVPTPPESRSTPSGYWLERHDRDLVSPEDRRRRPLPAGL